MDEYRNVFFSGVVFTIFLKEVRVECFRKVSVCVYANVFRRVGYILNCAYRAVKTTCLLTYGVSRFSKACIGDGPACIGDEL